MGHNHNFFPFPLDGVRGVNEVALLYPIFDQGTHFSKSFEYIGFYDYGPSPCSSRTILQLPCKCKGLAPDVVGAVWEFVADTTLFSATR